MDSGELAWLIAPGLATGVGGLALLLLRRPTERGLGTDDPRGFAAAAPLVEARASRRSAAWVAALPRAVEPPAALLAFASFELAESLLPVGLAFAAGAMLYVIVDEPAPESHGHGHERDAWLALVGGFALMMALDNAFG